MTQPPVEILSISSVDPVPGVLVGFALDSPKLGESSEHYSFTVEGWVVAREKPILGVEIWYGDRPIRRVPLNVPRPDVAEYYGTKLPDASCGFWSMIGVVGFPPEFDLVVRVIFDEKSEPVEIATIRVRCGNIASAFWPKIQPLMITSMGRTGTTWLMKLLSVSPGMVTFDAYPYEMRPAKYWMHMLRVAAEPANHLESSHWGDFSHDLHWIGSNPNFTAPLTDQRPLLDWFGKTYVESLAEFCQQSVQSFYETLASAQRVESPRYFVEKSYPDHVPWLLWGLYPKAREIVLVRDFRDMVASIYATNAKRGTKDFGRGEVAKDDEYIRRLGTHAQHLCECWEMRRNRAHLVRYEDLILKPAETLTAIFDYLGVDSSPKCVEAVLRAASVDNKEMQEHRTVTDITKSVGRWRRDLSPAMRKKCNAVFGDFMRRFGYAPETRA